MKYIIKESIFKKLTNRLINENYFDSDKLYHRESLVRKLLIKDSKGYYVTPKPIRDIIEKLPYIECEDQNGNKTTCTKIPEVLFVYLTGRY